MIAERATAMGLIKVCPWNFSGNSLKPVEVVMMKF